MNACRNLLRNLELPLTQRLIKESSVEDLERLVQITRDINYKGVLTWVRTNKSLDYENWLLSDLEDLARQYDIPGASTTSKELLVRRIRLYEEARENRTNAQMGTLDSQCDKVPSSGIGTK